MPRLALVGDYSEKVPAHRAIPLALSRANAASGCNVSWSWFGTETVTDATRQLATYDGVWCVPASPYRSMDGAFAAIRFARETGRPFLGTCGGFQHALIEFARNVAKIDGADHEETAPAVSSLSKSADGGRAEGHHLVVTKLACSLVEQSGAVLFTPGSQLHRIFGGAPTCGEYRCNYGMNPSYRTKLESAGLRFTGFDETGDIRAAELPGHPFFIGTLFQPERSALHDRDHPLIQAFVQTLTVSNAG